MPALSEFDVDSLTHLFEGWGYPRGNTKKLLRRYYDSGGESIDGVQVARELKARVLSEIGLRSTRILTRRQATDGTVKLLVGVPSSANPLLPTASSASASVGCVLMPSYRSDRAAGCVSSQVGCAMGCDFCASTKAGVERSLTAGEMVE